MKITKIITCIMMLIIILGINTKVQAKYTYTEIETSIKFNIDRTAPEAEINYIQDEESVLVIIDTNEKVMPIDGWEINEEQNILTKNYYENIEEQIRIYDLAGNFTCVNVIISSIKEDKIEISMYDFRNSNTVNSQYANSSHLIDIWYEISAKSKIMDLLIFDEIVVKVDGNIVDDSSKELIKLETDYKNNKYKYLLRIKNLEENGNLTVEFKEDCMQTENNIKNELFVHNTGITIDNISPNVTILEEQLESGCSRITISCDEVVIPKDGWAVSENQMTMIKEFPSNVCYSIEISDLTGNKTETKINVTKATFIDIIYGSYNSNVGWSFENNGQIAGKDAALASQNNKTESLIFRVEGNVEKDFLMRKRLCVLLLDK